jgi:uncharacterized protein with LGFP repeats
MSAIDDKWQQIQWIGQPVDEGAGSAEMALPDGRGRARDFQNGSIYWTQQTGAHEVHGGIRLKWAQLRGERGFLGYPVTDESGTLDGQGRYNHFEGGSIFWRDDIGAHEVHGFIRDKWGELDWEHGRLGWPMSDEHDIPGGRASTFQHGTITWTQDGGAVVRMHNID